MSTVLIEPSEKEAQLGKDGPGGGGDRDQGGRGGGDGDRRPREEPSSLDTARLGLLLLLATISMLFAAFTSAYIVRRAADDWVPIRVPPLLWLNTAILLASSFTMERARRALAPWRPQIVGRSLALTFLLGAAFLAGQVLAWRDLAAQGVYLASNPYSSFFYVLTGAHAVHVLGGIAVLGYVAIQFRRQRYSAAGAIGPRLAATYWHFVDGLWVYLFLVLFVI